jgi:hypothetical protein
LAHGDRREKDHATYLLEWTLVDSRLLPIKLTAMNSG